MIDELFCHMPVGFDKYKGGLDTVHDLTGFYSVYTNWRSIEIMFHVSTQLPYEKHDPQKVRVRTSTSSALFQAFYKVLYLDYQLMTSSPIMQTVQ